MKEHKKIKTSKKLENNNLKKTNKKSSSKNNVINKIIDKKKHIEKITKLENTINKQLFELKKIENLNYFNLYLNQSLYNIQESFIKYEKYIQNILEKNFNIDKKFFEKLIENEKNLIQLNLKNLRDIFFEKLFISKINKKYFPIINQLFSQIKRETIILINMINSFSNFKFDINYKNLKKIDYERLEFADIVLSYKSDEIIKQNFTYKLIKFITQSHIEHSSLYYKKIKNKYLFLDTKQIPTVFNKTKFELYPMNYSKNEIGIVLRLKKGLNQNEKKLIEEYILKSIGIKYGVLKAFYLAFNLEIFKKIPNLKTLKNPFEKEKIFCSQMIADAYEYAGIIISNREDNATITPIDLLNLDDFKIIGYIDKKQ